MQISQRTLKSLEYDRIVQMLAEVSFTEGAKQLAYTLMPSDDYEIVCKRQARTADARRLAGVKGYPPFGKVADIIEAAERADRGATISTRELMDIAALLFTARALEDYISTNKPFDTALDSVFSRLLSNRPLEEKINRAILAEDMIADEASPELSDIRRKIRAENNKIKETLQQYVSGQRSKFLQENIITLRNGRYVVPVKAEHRGEIKGLVHDTSASGATVFIEPMGVVEANNELRALANREQKEIDRILAELSAACGAFASALILNYRNITELAFAFSCAALAERMKATPPILSENPKILLNCARHPLLHPQKVVPITVSLGSTFDTLVITGPNTGGKTVTLKTLGLFALMAQAGLQIPAEENSELGVFSGVLADIGDEQSIEQSLSTFSAHMVNIVDMLHVADDRTLVLFDELGAGTDPVEGAALAISVLEAMRKKGSLSAATTHYAELKSFALETEGVQNASCEFDIETLRPTYRLVIGTPGKSNAFAISEKLGLDAAIVARANALVAEESRHFEKVIERLEKDRIAMERNREETERLREEYAVFKREAEIRLAEKTKVAEEEVQKNREKARQMLDSARATSEYILKELDTLRKKQESRDFAKALSEVRNDIRERLRREDESQGAFDFEEINLEEEYILPRPLKLKDRVYLVSFGQEGEVVALPDKDGNVQVRAGILNAKTHISKLRLLEGGEKKREGKKIPAPMNRSKGTRQIKIAFKSELDVRGNIGEDAWYQVDKYLDDAILAGIGSVRIIHGKGTGALRKALWEYFRTDPRVKAFRQGAYGEGDAGVTIIELK